jgi:hypothetical protein
MAFAILIDVDGNGLQRSGLRNSSAVIEKTFIDIGKTRIFVAPAQLIENSMIGNLS